MYTIIKNVIQSGRYELTDMLKKIDTMWIQGILAESERMELIEFARQKSTPEMGYQPIFEQLADLRRVNSDIMARLEKLENPEEDKPLTPDVPVLDEYPEYKQPTGAHDAYYTGDKITFNGKRYECIAPEGYGVAYDPVTLPGMWQEVVI